MGRRNILLASTTSIVSKNNYNYMTILALEDGLQAKLSGNTISYSLDEGNTWTSLASNTYTPTVNSGQTIMFKGNLTPNLSSGIGKFTISKKCNLEGNCMSLLFGDDVVNNNSLSGKNYAFYKLFSGCTTIMRVSESFLPATTLANYCYQYMFQGCTGLTQAPELPAITLASGCYSNMFYNCISLTSAPELPATRLDYGCYNRMFQGCSNLTTAPELLATTLASNCYYGMFYGCTSLTSAPELPAATLTGYCYSNMFYGCTSLTAAPELPATTLASYCYYYMFYGCTSLTQAPELPATTLASYCYYYMFYGCNKLNYIKMLAADISASNCLSNWVNGVSSTGTFVKNPAMTSLPTGINGIPSGWTVVDDTGGGSSLTIPIKLYEGNNDLDAKLVIDYIKSLDTDGDGYVGGSDDGIQFLKNIINFNDLYYPIGCYVYDDYISGASWYCLSDDSHMDDVMSWRFNLDGTLVIEWD